jgi:hypothetical protein
VKVLATCWLNTLQKAGELRLRQLPYQGKATVVSLALLRKRHGQLQYVGIELGRTSALSLKADPVVLLRDDIASLEDGDGVAKAVDAASCGDALAVRHSDQPEVSQSIQRRLRKLSRLVDSSAPAASRPATAGGLVKQTDRFQLLLLNTESLISALRTVVHYKPQELWPVLEIHRMPFTRQSQPVGAQDTDVIF